MSEPFIGEIRIFPYAFAPVGWAFCNGDLLQISQHTPLFSIIGTSYGGDGLIKFALPNMHDRVPLGADTSHHLLGSHGGASTVTLTEDQLPSHNHPMIATSEEADTHLCGRNTMLGAVSGRGNKMYSNATDKLAPLSSRAMSSTGNTKPHENRQPFLVLNFCIALEGVYPQRS